MAERCAGRCCASLLGLLLGACLSERCVQGGLERELLVLAVEVGAVLGEVLGQVGALGVGCGGRVLQVGRLAWGVEIRCEVVSTLCSSGRRMGHQPHPQLAHCKSMTFKMFMTGGHQHRCAAGARLWAENHRC